MPQAQQQLSLNLHPKQAQFYHSDKFEVLFGGGADAGKSYAGIWKVFARASFPGAFEGVFRLTNTKWATTFLRDWGNYIPASYYSHHKEEQIIRIHGGGMIGYMGCDDEQKLGSNNLSGAYFEELAEQRNATAYYKVRTLVRHGVPGLANQVYGVTNPSELADHWLIEHFGIGKRPLANVETENTLYIHTTCHDTGRDDAWVGRRYPPSMPSFYRDRLLWGRWGVVSQGRVFDRFCERHVTEQPIAGRRVIVGVDEGSTDDNPFAALRIEGDGDRLYITREFFKRGLTDPRAKVAAVMEMADDAELVVVDYSAKWLVKMLAEAGLPAVPCKKGAKSITAGIDRVRVRLDTAPDGRPNLLAHSSCEHFAREMRGYQYAPVTGVPKDENNHLIDCLRYAAWHFDTGKPVAIGWDLRPGEDRPRQLPQPERTFAEVINDHSAWKPPTGAGSNYAWLHG